MKKNAVFAFIIMLPFFMQCKNSGSACVIREWKVMDLYRNNYPSFNDTSCDGSIDLINKVKVAHSFPDSVFTHIGASSAFSIDTNGTYEVIADAIIEANGLKYETAKVRYLGRGYNIDQAFILYVVRNRGVYIQQESHDKKLFLLKQIKNETAQLENTENVVDQMIKDTILFPLPPARL